MVSIIPPFDGKIDRFLKCMIVLLHLFAILSGLLFGSGRAQGLGKNLLSQSFEAKFFAGTASGLGTQKFFLTSTVGASVL